MVSTKDDPTGGGGHHTYQGRTLWLSRDNVELARDNFWHAFHEHAPASDKNTWDTAWAAAIAAYTYVMEGRVEP